MAALHDWLALEESQLVPHCSAPTFDSFHCGGATRHWPVATAFWAPMLTLLVPADRRIRTSRRTGNAAGDMFNYGGRSNGRDRGHRNSQVRHHCGGGHRSRQHKQPKSGTSRTVVSHKGRGWRLYLCGALASHGHGIRGFGGNQVCVSKLRPADVVY